MVLMPSYKRNQVEEAISKLYQPKARKPSMELRTRIKRLLETDRAFGANPRAQDAQRATYAFYSAEPPGSGVEVWFSSYEAFAVLTGLRLLAHGWPQSVVVRVLRQARTELEKHHARILMQDPDELFDQKKIERTAKVGDMAFDNTDPPLLTIVSKSPIASGGEAGSFECAVCRGADEAMKWAWSPGRRASSFTMFEIATTTYALAQRLNETEPRQRGRGA